MLDEINKSYAQNLIDFLVKDKEIDKKINLITSQYNLENCKNDEFIILLASCEYSSYSVIKSLLKRLNLFEASINGFILLEQ